VIRFEMSHSKHNLAPHKSPIASPTAVWSFCFIHRFIMFTAAAISPLWVHLKG
jgi:hypothetical protein